MSQRGPFPHKALLPLHPLQCMQISCWWDLAEETLQLWQERAAAWWGKSFHTGFVLGKQKLCTALGQVKFLWPAPAWHSPVHNGSWRLGELLLQAAHSAVVPTGVWLVFNHLLIIFLHHCKAQSLKPTVVNLSFPFFYGTSPELHLFFSFPPRPATDTVIPAAEVDGSNGLKS